MATVSTFEQPQSLQSEAQDGQRQDSNVLATRVDDQTMDQRTSQVNVMLHPATPQDVSNELASETVRVPGTFPPEWLPDQMVDSCMACDSLFTLIKRRHHCRACGRIFCGDCCKRKAKLLFLNNKEARVCGSCLNLLEYSLSETQSSYGSSNIDTRSDHPSLSSSPVPSSSTITTASNQSQQTAITKVKVPCSVLKSSNQTRFGSVQNETCNASSSSSSDQQVSNKQVIFSDGIRPGTDLSEAHSSSLTPSSSTESPVHSSQSFLSRQHKKSSDDDANSSLRKAKYSGKNRNVTVCDELGYLPPIVISKESPIISESTSVTHATSNSLAALITNQMRLSRKAIHVSMESRDSPLNGVVKFEDISNLVGVNNVITFLLLKNFYLKAKILRDLSESQEFKTENVKVHETLDTENSSPRNVNEYWCFVSNGLEKFGQDEVMFVLDKDKDNSCIPRDIFKIYLTLHELALRRQSIESLGNLLFQDGLFGSRDTAGLLFVHPAQEHCLRNLIPVEGKFLFALVLQRWEVPWSKVFPMRLLLRLGHKFGVYPYPFISYREREPVYYEIGHTIISILGDFRNFRYSLTHVDGLIVLLERLSRTVKVHLHQSNYQQFSKVLDSSNNEHVLAWSSCPYSEADGHLVSLQNEDGQYETVEFYKKPLGQTVSSSNECQKSVIAASFIVFSGALKLNQTGQQAKISIVEDGLLIQIQSCTMTALRNAIHYMDDFDIDCETIDDPLNRVEIRWRPSKES